MWQFHALEPRQQRALIALILAAMLIVLSGCATTPKPSLITAPPQIDCQERSPAELAVSLPSESEDWREWRRAALAWIGIATAETEKRATTADCLDALRDKGVIR